MAEFDDPNALVAAAQRARHEGYRRMDAYSPFPIEELHEALGMPAHAAAAHRAHRRAGRLPRRLSLCSTGCRPSRIRSNVGGRPLHSWPAFIPVTFECTILGAALVGGARHARAERAADAVSPGLQRAAVCAGEPQPVLSLHRGQGPAVRSREDTRRFLETLEPREVSTVAD